MRSSHCQRNGIWWARPTSMVLLLVAPISELERRTHQSWSYQDNRVNYCAFQEKMNDGIKFPNDASGVLGSSARIAVFCQCCTHHRLVQKGDRAMPRAFAFT